MPFATVTCLGNYERLLRDLVIQMKSTQGQALAIQLGLWLGEKTHTRTEDHGPEHSLVPGHIDFVTPIPIHWKRRIGRGHNVASLLAESIAGTPGFPVKLRNLLAMTRQTQKQGTLTLSQRFENVKNCFALSGKPDIDSASILLVDDVMTSGATAIQAASVLRQAGANRVHLAIVARGVGPSP